MAHHLPHLLGATVGRLKGGQVLPIQDRRAGECIADGLSCTLDQPGSGSDLLRRMLNQNPVHPQ